MALFVVSHRSSDDTVAAWRRLTDWPAHARYVPMTTIAVTTPGPNGIGTTFVAHTGVGRLGFDDPMQITAWDAPDAGGSGRCRLDKLGRIVLGWAELTVEPSGSGTLATWREDVSVARLPRIADGPTAFSSRLLFGRVLRRLLED